MDFITYVQEALLEQLPQLVKSYEENVRASDLGTMERSVRQMTHELGNSLLRVWLEGQDERYPSAEKACIHCGEQAQYVKRRAGTVITLLGRVSYRRAYYGCSHCGHGFYPLDERLGIAAGQMSEEVVKLAGLFGIEDAFGTSQDLLKRATLLDLSPNSIRKASRQMGQAVVEQEQDLQQQSQSLEAQRQHKRTTPKPRRLYGSLDGYMVLLDDGWHEMKAGTWWTTRTTAQGELKATDIHYYTDLLAAHEFSDLVWATGFDHLADQAVELVFVADGAEWIWNIVDLHFPNAIQIVDWYHACSYLTPVAKTAFTDPTAQTLWIEKMTTALWNGQLDTVIDACRTLAPPASKRDDHPAALAVTYFTNQRSRMDYPAYRAAGLQVGSGTMESACKRLGLERLKIAGACWSHDGARLIAKARAVYLSGRWDTIQPARQIA